MYRFSAFVLSLVCVAMFATVAAADPEIDIAVTAGTSPWTHVVTFTGVGGQNFQAVRWPAGKKDTVEAVPASGWTCTNGQHTTTTSSDTNAKYNGAICKGGSLNSLTVHIATANTRVVPGEGFQNQSGTGVPGDPLSLSGHLNAVTGSDDIPSTIDSGPAMGFWAALGLVLLVLAGLSWFLWPRHRREATA